jgi:CubicO group peptidase (beta-lactamase class C family)
MPKAKVRFICIIIVLSSIFLSAVNTNTISAFQDSEAIDDFVSQQMKAGNIPGLSLGIVKDDQILYVKGYGKADETNRLVTPQTPFMIGSITKSFTALAIRQLVNEGKIVLDTPVKDYIPWFQISDIEASKKITIRNLLDHTSGISTKASYEYELYNDRYDLVQAVQMLTRVKLNRPIGESYEYSNINYIILGLVIQNVTGISYGEYIKNNIFVPLQMKNSYCTESEAKNNGLARGYQLCFGFMMPRSVPHSKALLPAGNLMASVEDMAQYLIAYINNGEYQNSNITKELNSVSNTYVNHDYYWNPRSLSYLTNGYPEIAGGAFNYSSDMIILTREKIGVVVLANTNNGTLSASTIGPISIANGIVKMFLVPQEYQPATNDIKRLYFNLDFIMLIILLIFAMQVLNFIKKRNSVFRSRLSLSMYLVVFAVTNIIIPLGVLYGLPWITNNEHPTWAMVTLALPDIGYFCLITSVLFLTMGIVKTCHLLIYMKTSLHKKPLQDA